MNIQNKITTKIEIMNRLKTLENRYDRLLKANDENHFTQSGNSRTEKYFTCMLYIKKEIATEINKNTIINNNLNSKVRQGFLNAQNGFTMADLRLLTQP